MTRLPAILNSRLWFPNPREAPSEAGSEIPLALGGDLSVPRLLLAYRSGLFPWSVAPITWWSPDPRAVLEWGDVHVSRSLQRVLRQQSFQITHDRDFSAVIRACAAPRPGRWSTWISPEFIRAYLALHRDGHAHSVECWQEDQLVGGIYGVAIGGLFAGESMFHRVPDASKVALVHLTDHLRARGFIVFDIQMTTTITLQLGATTIPRSEYLDRLAQAVNLDVTF